MISFIVFAVSISFIFSFIKAFSKTLIIFYTTTSSLFLTNIFNVPIRITLLTTFFHRFLMGLTCDKLYKLGFGHTVSQARR